MPYRLVVADLDGTLMGEDVRFSPAVLSAVSGVIERGLHFTVATGRTFHGARPFLDQLHVNAPVILFQGGAIRDARNGELLHQVTIPVDCAHEFIAWAQQRGLHVNVYLDDDVYVARETAELRFYVQLNQVTVRAVDDLLCYVRRPVMKLLLIAEPGRLDAIAPQLGEQFAGRLQIVRSHARFLEAVPPGVNKGRGLAWLASYLGIPQAETVALGDNDNDAEMVAWAGLGIAMGNASEATKAAANVIAPSVQHDGAAWAIQTYVLAAAAEDEHDLRR